MDDGMKSRCRGILNVLLNHRYAWVFMVLEIPDYLDIITNPMDLGTAKSKVDNGLYVSINGFVYDMRLTFSNAMTYNPPSDDVHFMAKNVSDVFEAMLTLLWNLLILPTKLIEWPGRWGEEFGTKSKLFDEENMKD